MIYVEVLLVKVCELILKKVTNYVTTVNLRSKIQHT